MSSFRFGRDGGHSSGGGLGWWSSTPAAGPPIPPGRYRCVVAKGGRAVFHTGTPYFGVMLEIADGRFAGRGLQYLGWLTEPAGPYTKANLAVVGITSPEQLDRPLAGGQAVVAVVELHAREDGREFNKVVSLEDDEPTPSADFIVTEPEAGLSVREFALSLGFVMSEGQLSSIGNEAARRCRSRGVEPDRAYDGRRLANRYPSGVLAEMRPGVEAIGRAGFEATEGPIPGGLWWRCYRPWEVVEGDPADR